MIYYIRDEEGSLIGLKYNNKIYYYIKNLQEDIIGITDSNYNEVCRYEYDSFGRIITIKDNNENIIGDESHIGIINPYRYRSYYYDKETRVYYLNSRYYNPEWGRFINADKYVSTQQGMLSTNMYQYTENNPISRADTLGVFWFIVGRVVLGGVIAGVVQVTSNIMNGDKITDGLLGSVLGGMFAGGISATPLNFTTRGALIMNYGGAAVENSVNVLSGNSSLLEGATNTLIGGTIGMTTPSVYDIKKNWIKPTTITTSFTGNYQKKMVVNDIVSSTTSAAINKPISDSKKIKQQKEQKQAQKNAEILVGTGLSFIDSVFDAIASL